MTADLDDLVLEHLRAIWGTLTPVTPMTPYMVAVPLIHGALTADH